MNDSTLDLAPYSEEQRLDFYGALFAMSTVDRHVDEREDDTIFERMKLETLSADARKKVLQLAIHPPPLERCLLTFKDAPSELRLALMLNLIAIVLADGVIEPEEHVGLHEARNVLGVSRDQMADMLESAFQAQQTDLLGRPVPPIRSAS